MQRNGWPLLALLTSCAGAAPGDASVMLAGAVAGPQARLTIVGDKLVAVVTPIDHRALPAAVRAACDAEAPGGQVTFCGQERGPAGRGYRIEKRLPTPAPHERSLLVAEDGRLLERRRTVPLQQAPDAVLATALAHGSFVHRVEIVAGPGRDERWVVVVTDRAGGAFAVDVELDGRLRVARRRTTARVDS